jgi:hypothetical protein
VAKQCRRSVLRIRRLPILRSVLRRYWRVRQRKS